LVSKELFEGPYEPLWLLDMGQVPTAGDELEGALVEASDRCGCMPNRDYLVLYSPYD
jgi:hypothetical protein